MSGIYPEVCPIQLDKDGGYYCRHVDAMTREALHGKSDIAIQLGWRDREIDRLRAELAAKSKDVADLQEVLTSIQEYASSLEYMGKWANAEYGDRCRHKIAREIQEIMGDGNGR